MNRFLCIVLIAAISMAAVSCKKDGVFSPKEKIVAVYHQETKVLNGETTTVGKYKSEEWIWDGNLLKEMVSYNEDGTSAGKRLLSYEGKRLVKLSDESGGYYTEYVYKSGKLTKISMVSGGEVLFAADVEHDGSFISKMKMSVDIPDSIGADFAKRSLSMVVPQQVADIAVLTGCSRSKQAMGISLNFSYTDKNMTKLAVVVSGMTIMTVNFTYDKMKNPMQGCYATLGPSALSKNNVVEAKSSGLINSLPMEGLELPTNQKYAYTYNADDYPETVTTTASVSDDGVSTTTTSTTYYEYGE